MAAFPIDAISRLIAEYPSRQDEVFGGTWKEATVKAGLLPVFSDWTCEFALNTAGEPMFRFEAGWEPVTSPYYRHIVLTQASIRFPLLIELTPKREPDSEVCKFCNGAGVISAGGKTYRDLICQCGGIGWVPPKPYFGLPSADLSKG